MFLFLYLELPPFVCYKCGTINPKKNEDDRNSIDSTEEHILRSPHSPSPKGVKRGRDGSFLDSISVSSRESYSILNSTESSLNHLLDPIKVSSNPFGDSEEGPLNPYHDPFGERSNNHILDPHVEGSSNSFLLTALEVRGKEIMQLKRKLLRSDNEKADISQKYIKLENKYDALFMEFKGKGGKLKKKKNLIQRIVSAINCQSVKKDQIYSPKKDVDLRIVM